MPVTTRIQADAEGLKDEDMVDLEHPPNLEDVSGEAHKAGSVEFDEANYYHPLFVLSNDVPDEVLIQPYPVNVIVLVKESHS